MPFVTAHYLAKLASREAPTFSRHHDGRLGCPALFAQSTFPALLSLTGERGAASLEFSPRHVMEPREPAMLDDIDEKQDLDSQAHQAPAAKLDG
jgi:CTP:molybdopterin cytidylyltransferase MocA